MLGRLLLSMAPWFLTLAGGVSNHGLPQLGKVCLLIIAPKQFSAAIAPLVRHKDQTGMPTAFVSLEDLKAASIGGEDDPAKIKQTIWAYATAKPVKATYVMLVGDMSLIPCRRRTIENLPGNPDALIWRWGYEPAELYYSNLFTGHKVNKAGDVVATSQELSSWDKDGNGHYNEQHWASDPVKFNPDAVDGCPDVALGRIPAHTVAEVATFVAKDVRYEVGERRDSNAAAKITLCFGKTYEESYDMTKAIREDKELLGRFSSHQIAMLGLGYAADSELPNNGDDCRKADLPTFNAALANSLWLGYLGHGSALGWDANLPNPPNSQHIDAHYVMSQDMPSVAENGRLPIIFGCGCETGRHAPGLPRDEYLDVNGKKHWFWWGDAQKNKEHRVVDADTGATFDAQVVIPAPSSYDIPKNQPRNFATSWLCANSSKGAIAYFGEELICQNDMGRDLEIRVLQNLNPKEKDCILGDAWLSGQRLYWKDYHDYEGDNCVFRNARIYLGIMNFYGDPSLRIR